jgi:predicted lipid-binding transport protein (Tim44 family)
VNASVFSLKKIAAAAMFALVVLVMIVRTWDMPREEWVPFLAICIIFAAIYKLMGRFMRGPVSTALMGMFFGIVIMGLFFLFLGVPSDPLVLLLIAAGYGLIVILIYEGKRLDTEEAAASGDTVQPNFSSSGRATSARRSTER